VVHDPVIGLRVLDEPRVRRGIQPLLALLAEAIDLLLQEVLQHLDDADFAAGIAFQQRVASVNLRIVGPRFEAAVA
jgi:hypothetical protein